MRPFMILNNPDNKTSKILPQILCMNTKDFSMKRQYMVMFSAN